MDGLRYKVGHDELRAHCQARASYHSGRADEKTRALPELKAALELIRHKAPQQQVADVVPKESLSWLNEATGGPLLGPNYYARLDADGVLRDLEADIKNHESKAAAFRFAADHLFDQDYALSCGELVELEMLRSK